MLALTAEEGAGNNVAVTGSAATGPAIRVCLEDWCVIWS